MKLGFKLKATIVIVAAFALLLNVGMFLYNLFKRKKLQPQGEKYSKATMNILKEMMM